MGASTRGEGSPLGIGGDIPFQNGFTPIICRPVHHSHFSRISDYEVRLNTTTGREIPSTVWRNEQSLTIQPRVFERGLLIAMMYIDGVLYAKNVVAQ
ncbi:MAG: hypothetical protein ACO3A1_03360 [Flavobacteriaceae bacterium]